MFRLFEARFFVFALLLVFGGMLVGALVVGCVSLPFWFAIAPCALFFPRVYGRDESSIGERRVLLLTLEWKPLP